jgi:uncharacterized membrane protein YvbJ
VNYCPNCGATVESGAASCESCGAELSAVRDVVTRAVEQSAFVAPAGPTVADLTPRQLRKEIRWGVFQGILLIALIVFLVYLAIFLLIAGAVSGSVSGG